MSRSFHARPKVSLIKQGCFQCLREIKGFFQVGPMFALSVAKCMSGKGRLLIIDSQRANFRGEGSHPHLLLVSVVHEQQWVRY